METPNKTPGLIVAPLTPFTAKLTVDEPALQRQIDYIVDDCRATMVVAAGVETQEYTYLGFEERKALICRTIEGVDGRVPVMVGISHPSFKSAIELAHEAERLGAAAAVCRAADASRSDRLFRGHRPRDQAADHALSQSRAGRRRFHPRHHRAGKTAERAIDQGIVARSRPRVAADRRDRPCRTCALLHHHADALGDA